MTPLRSIAPGVVEIDTLLGGWTQATAGYLVTGENPVLVETGSQSSAPAVRSALGNLGLGPNDLAGIAVTHIHLDHAGGVGDIARAFPKATIYVHELGARHLADPARLIESAGKVYGPLLDSLYGRLDPTDPARIKVLHDGDVIEIGRRRKLEAIYTPGHAKHHLSLLDSESGVMFVGDSVGVRFPESTSLRPATPPADFDLFAAKESLRRSAERDPSVVALAHFGPDPHPETVFAEATEALEAWAAIAIGAWKSGTDIEEAFRVAFAADDQDLDAQVTKKLETLNGVASNAAGFRIWLEKNQPT